MQREETRLRQAAAAANRALRHGIWALVSSGVGLLLALLALLRRRCCSPGGTAPGEPPAHYEIRVRGVLDSQWSPWFEGLAITTDMPDQTLIAGPVTDQAALHGLLAKIRDLGLPLLSVRRIDPGQ
ncbi:MAG TPA: hypothetical protein VG035_02595 [Actinomycetota bacterium]|nr:hypothetical protein [Actinomycetota bacterium]